jgi:hypothetical protein
MTPAWKGGFGVAPSSRRFSPDLKRSMRMQGVRRPVSTNVHRSADMQLRVQRQRLEFEPGRRDVLAKIPGTDIEARVSQCIEQLARDEVNLPQVRRPRVSARQISMPDKLAVVGVAFDAISCRENDGEPWSLAEPVLGVDRYGDD